MLFDVQMHTMLAGVIIKQSAYVCIVLLTSLIQYNFFLTMCILVSLLLLLFSTCLFFLKKIIVRISLQLTFLIYLFRNIPPTDRHHLISLSLSHMNSHVLRLMNCQSYSAVVQFRHLFNDHLIYNIVSLDQLINQLIDQLTNDARTHVILSSSLLFPHTHTHTQDSTFLS